MFLMNTGSGDEEAMYSFMHNSIHEVNNESNVFHQMSRRTGRINLFKAAHLAKIGYFRSVKFWELDKGAVFFRILCWF